MAKYLYMDGLDDYITHPSMTFDKIEIDGLFSSTGSTQYVYIFWQPIVFRYRGNSGSQSSANPANTGFIMDTRTTLTITFPQTTGSLWTFFGGSYDWCRGNIYSIKLFNDDVLIAHYDMSTGTVLDQSGNGNHATLVGGTWMDDGGGGGNEGAEVSEVYSMHQSVYAERLFTPSLSQRIYKVVFGQSSTRQELFANRERNHTVKQSIFAHRTIEPTTAQTIYADRQSAHSTQQTIYRRFQTAYDTLQEIYDTSVVRIEDYAMQVIIHKDVSAEYATRQMLHKAVETSADLKNAISRLDVLNADTRQILTRQIDERFDVLQQVYADRKTDYDTLIQLRDDILSLIGTIHLKAKRILDINLKARQELFIHLRGDINMTMENQNFNMYAGDTKYIVLPVDNVEDLTGSKLRWGIRKSRLGQDILIMKTLDNGISIIDTNRVQLKLDEEDTKDLSGKLYHELELTDSLGNVSTVMVGEITVIRSGIK